MTDASKMRDYLNLFEGVADEYKGKVDSPDVTYHAEETKGMITKITVFLKSFQSGRFTKLGRKLKRIEWLEAQIKKLKEETKDETKSLLADWFHAEDALSTRIIETVGFIFQLSKDPKPTEVVKYAKVFEELQEHLAPELQKVAQELMKKHTSVVQKSPSLKTIDKSKQTAESINEGFGDKLKGFYAKLKNWVDQWGAKYDAKLDALKAQVGVHESIEEAEVSSLTDGDRVKIIDTHSQGYGEYGYITGMEDGMYEVQLEGTSFYGFYDADEIELAPAAN